LEKKKYQIILTTTYTYEVNASNGDEAINIAITNKVNDEKSKNTDAREDTILISEL